MLSICFDFNIPDHLRGQCGSYVRKRVRVRTVSTCAWYCVHSTDLQVRRWRVRVLGVAHEHGGLDEARHRGVRRAALEPPHQLPAAQLQVQVRVSRVHADGPHHSHSRTHCLLFSRASSLLAVSRLQTNCAPAAAPRREGDDSPLHRSEIPYPLTGPDCADRNARPRYK